MAKEAPLEIMMYSPHLEEMLKRLPMFELALLNELGPTTIDILAQGQRFLAKYPPPPPESTYVRTGTLGRSWSIDVRPVSFGIRGVLSNPTEYAPYVQFEGMQPVVHKGRWPTIQQLARGPLLKMAISKFQAAINRVIGKFFGF